MSKTLSLNTIDFCDIQIVKHTGEEFAAFAIEKSKEKNNYISFSLNGESLAKYHTDLVFKKLFLSSDFVHADGMSIVSASKLFSKNNLPERIATTDWFHDVAKLSDRTISHYFLGADPVTIQKTIENVKELYPSLNIVGFHHGYIEGEDLDETIKHICALRPNFIWLGLGRPKQEKIANRIKNIGGVGFIKTCGGLFDFLAGNNRRAPVLMQKIGMEWLFRLYLQPKRLFKRYFVTNCQTIAIVSKYLIKNKIKSLG